MKRLVLIGIGGAGLNMLSGVAARVAMPMLAVNRDALSLSRSSARSRVQLHAPKGTPEEIRAAMPFDFEGQERRSRAEHAYELLEAAAHQVICIDNQRLIREAPSGASMQEAFGMVADAIATWLGDFEAQNQGLVFPA